MICCIRHYFKYTMSSMEKSHNERKTATNENKNVLLIKMISTVVRNDFQLLVYSIQSRGVLWT
jgi:hypothetical protein